MSPFSYLALKIANRAAHGLFPFLLILSLLSLFIVLFVLPGLLYLLDGVIQHTTLNLHFYKVSKEEK